jgi:septum formation protein
MGVASRPKQPAPAGEAGAARRRWPSLVLASASPRRRELLAQMGVGFEVVTSEVNELHHEQLTARELCLLNAYRKARAVAKRFPDRVVLGADTLVHLDGALFPKPATLAEAQQMLRRLAGRTHQVVTGLCLLRLRAYRERLCWDITDVTFRPLSPEQIRGYVAAVNPLDKAGAYAIQERGELIVSEISGSYSNVVGLPVERLEAELDAWAVLA